MNYNKADTNEDDFFYNDDESYYKKSNSRSSRAREKAKARRKVDAYLDKKSLMKNLEDFDVNDFEFDDDDIWSYYEQSFYEDVDNSTNYDGYIN